MKGRGLSSGDFARAAGVTVRTVRYYDRLHLLRPATRRFDGRRSYGAEELVRLQQILTLKLLGFSLQEISTILDAPRFNLAQALAMQQRQVAERIDRLQRVLRAIERAQETLAGGVDWERFADIITAMQMEDQYQKWVREYYTEEQLAELAARPFSAEDQAKAQQKWADILAEAKWLAESGADPAGAEAQALAARYQGMIDAFTGGNTGIDASLNRMYADKANMPAEMRAQFAEPVGSFTSAMLEAYRERP